MRSFCSAKASLILSTKNFSVFSNKVVKYLRVDLLTSSLRFEQPSPGHFGIKFAQITHTLQVCVMIAGNAATSVDSVQTAF